MGYWEDGTFLKNVAQYLAQSKQLIKASYDYRNQVYIWLYTCDCKDYKEKNYNFIVIFIVLFTVNIRYPLPHPWGNYRAFINYSRYIFYICC